MTSLCGSITHAARVPTAALIIVTFNEPGTWVASCSRVARPSTSVAPCSVSSYTRPGVNPPRVQRYRASVSRHLTGVTNTSGEELYFFTP